MVACSSPPEHSETKAYLNGTEGGFDFALDAPWRMERHVAKEGAAYDPVPINITILDEDLNDMDAGGRLYTVCRIDVTTGAGTGETTKFAIKDLAWIERTGRGPGPTYWPFPDENLPPPTNTVCFPSQGSCSHMDTVYDTSEWHALAEWRGEPRPGESEVFELVAHVTGRDNDCFSANAHMIELVNYAKVTWAKDPLPRFGDDRWVYGDLHYHSQSTDNEGESGYSYRAALQGAAAVGLDFVFATDHASDSEQLVDGDVTDLDWPPILNYETRGLRDLNQPRFDAALGLVHGPTGANAHLASWWPSTRARLPRLFLGGEVDAVPEIPTRPSFPSTGPAWQLPYGQDKRLDLEDNICDAGIWCSADDWSLDELFPAFIDVHGAEAFSVADLQGINALGLGRQHILHLPRFANEASGFVGSRTTRFGGGSRHLVEGHCFSDAPCNGLGLLPEIGAKHGIAFLAHPNSLGGGDRGPGSVPYTDYQYAKAFGEQAFTGLEFWNESARRQSDEDHSTCDFGMFGYSPVLEGGGNGDHVPGHDAHRFELVPVDDLATWQWSTFRFDTDYDLHNGSATWDNLLRWGLDRGRTSAIPWLPASEPRKLFAAGGSDAHGDFSYRRNGYFIGLSSTTDTAIGNIRNLVFAGAPQPPCAESGCELGTQGPARHTQDQVVDALAAGRFSVTDGPALRIGVDRDGDGVLEDSDTQMGGTLDLFEGEKLPIVVEWDSTEETGDVARIDLYVGVALDPCKGDPSCTASPDDARTRTYAAEDHFVRLEQAESQFTGGAGYAPDRDADATHAVPQSDGTRRYADGYFRPNNVAGRLALRVLADTMSGKQTVIIDPDNYTIDGQRPSRLYVRAVAVTAACDPLDPVNHTRALQGDCIARYAMTNPVWSVEQKLGNECPIGDRALDADHDGLPDACDPAPDQASETWTRVFGGTNLDDATSIAFTPTGDVVTGGTIFERGRIEGRGGEVFAQDHDGLVVRHSRIGELLAQFRVTGASWSNVHDVAIDAAGNVYAVGSFVGFGGFGATFLPALHETGFLVKLRPDLSVEWVRTLAGKDRVTLRRLEVIPGNLGVVMAGDFASTIESNLGTFTVTGGGSDCVVAAFRPNGQIGTIHTLTGDGPCTATAVATDGLGRSYVAGNYSAGVELAGGMLPRPPSGMSGAFVARFGAPNVWWTPELLGGFASPVNTREATIGGLVVDAMGNVTVGGSYRGALIFARPDGASWTLFSSTAGSWDMFVARIDTNTIPVGPHARYGGTDADTLRAIAGRSNGDVAIAGDFLSPWFAVGSATVTRRAGRDGVLALVPLSGTPTIRNFGSIADNRAKSIALASDARLAVAGTFFDSARIDDIRTAHALGQWDGFAAVLPIPPLPPGSFGNSQ